MSAWIVALLLGVASMIATTIITRRELTRRAEREREHAVLQERDRQLERREHAARATGEDARRILDDLEVERRETREARGELEDRMSSRMSRWGGS